MANDSTDILIEQIRGLPREQQRDLLVEIQRMLASTVANEPTPRIMDLRGLGKEIWTGMDVDEYLRNERSSWDG